MKHIYYLIITVKIMNGLYILVPETTAESSETFFATTYYYKNWKR